MEMLGKEYDMATDALKLRRGCTMAVIGLVVMGSLCGLFGRNMVSHEIYGVVTPSGPMYFLPKPPDWVQRHEECHYERLKEMGALSYYLDYMANYPDEEVRCGQVVTK